LKKTLIKIWQKFPHHYRKKIDIIRRRSIWKKNHAIFVHVPKAAGVSVNNAIYGRPLGHFYASDIKRICPKTFNNIFTFSVVRHPVERLYSAYTFARNGGTNVMGMYKSSYYTNHPDFETFERFVNNWLSKKELAKLDGVFCPQYLYLFDKEDQLLVDKVYQLEKIENYYDEISQNIYKPFSLDHHNISDKKISHITDELKDTIYQLYRKDFELLDYFI
jgi:chondroitin 4-sulfotransferase 11